MSSVEQIRVWVVYVKTYWKAPMKDYILLSIDVVPALPSGRDNRDG